MALWRSPQWPARHGGLRVSLAKRRIPGSGNVPSESPIVQPLGILCFAGDKASLSSEPVTPVSVTETQGQVAPPGDRLQEQKRTGAPRDILQRIRGCVCSGTSI